MENENNRTFDDILDEIDQLVNREEILERLDALAIKANCLTEEQRVGDVTDLSFPYHNYLFIGNPGTEKTKSARLFAEVLYLMGYVQNENFIIVSPSELEGDTEIEIRDKVESAFNRAKGGVLYIDDFNCLCNEEEDMMKRIILDNILMCVVHRDKDQVVIFSGYKKEINKILEANPMLSPRIYNQIEFRDYTAEELTGLFLIEAEDEGYELTEEALRKVLDVFEYIWKTRGMYFENSHVASRLWSETKRHHAKRLMSSHNASTVPYELITRIEAEDIPESIKN